MDLLSNHEALDVLVIIFSELFGWSGTDRRDLAEHGLEEWDGELALQILKVLKAGQDSGLSENAVKI